MSSSMFAMRSVQRFTKNEKNEALGILERIKKVTSESYARESMLTVVSERSEASFSPIPVAAAAALEKSGASYWAKLSEQATRAAIDSDNVIFLSHHRSKKTNKGEVTEDAFPSEFYEYFEITPSGQGVA